MGTKFPSLLGLTNLILLVSSTILMYLGSALTTFYLLDSLDFISVWFAVVPNIMVALGVSCFVVAIYGGFVAANANRSGNDQLIGIARMSCQYAG